MCNSKCCCAKGGICTVATISKILLIAGGLNWGLVGLGILFGVTESWNVLNTLLGSMPVVEGLVYVLVGLAAVMEIFGGCRCGRCKNGVCASCVEEEKTEAKM